MNEEIDTNAIHEVIIIGSGPAGLTAALYAARARLNPIVIAGSVWGGQLMTTTIVENYPGFPDGINGPDLMENMRKQAENFGAKVLNLDVTKVSLDKEVKEVHVGDKIFKSKSVIIATGASPRLLNIPGEQEFWAKGVSSCATCDGAFFRNKVVAVVGGGDSAVEEASFLTRFATKVYVIHRRGEFRASKIMQERLTTDPKIEVILNTEIKEVLGSTKVEGLKLFNNVTNVESELPVNGMFLAIGHIPNTAFLDDQLELNPEKYLIAEHGVYTGIDGVFVAGDVEDHMFRQAITAAGAGCKAAIVAERWLQTLN
jgi:thioredoxin reductase (NADPH)